MKEEKIAELDFYKYRIKKGYLYDSYGDEEVKYYTERKVPILGWIYFEGLKNLSPFDSDYRENYGIWYWITTSLLAATAIVLAIVILASSKTWVPYENTLLSLYWILGSLTLSQILFYWFGYKYAFGGVNNEEKARQRIYKRAEYWQKIKIKRKFEIIEVSLKNERKRKLEKIK